MIGRRWIALLIGLVLAPFAAGAAQGRREAAAEPPAAPVEVHTAVSRTAVWVGDRITYAIQLRCSSGIDLLLEDLAQERIRIDGGEIEQVETERSERGEDLVYRLRYTLLTYRVDAPEIRIEPIPVRYYARGSAGTGGAPAGQVTVPALVVPVRSTLPETREAITPRPPPPPRMAPLSVRLAFPIGLGLVLLTIAPVAIWGLDLGRRATNAYAAHRARVERRRRRRTFTEIKALEPVSDVGRLDAYGQLDAFVRDHLEAATGVETHALTPSEVRTALAGVHAGVPADEIEHLLAACERARYARERPTAEDWAEAVRQTEQALGIAAP